jgi:PAS domain S-box-containing protein
MSDNKKTNEQLIKELAELRQENNSMKLKIAELSKTKEDFTANEESYFSLFKNSYDAILLTEPNGRIISANKAACEMFLRTEQEICGLGRSGLVDETDERLSVLLEERKRNRYARGELTLIRGDGSKFEAEVTSKVFSDKDGNDITSMIIRDITERKRAEEELKESEDRYKSLSTLTTEGIMIHKDGVILDANLSFAKLSNYSTPEELIGMKGLEVIPMTTESRQKIIAHMQSGSNDKYEIELIGKDGKLFHAETFGKNITYNGQNARLISMLDITERKQVEYALKESEERYRLLTESSPDAIMIYSDGIIVYANPSAKVLFSANNSDKLIGTPIFNYVHEDNIPVVKDRISTIIYGKEHIPIIEDKLIKMDGTIFDAEVSMIPFNYKGKSSVQVIIRDISDRKKTEQALIKSEQKYTNLVENITDVIFSVNTDGILDYISPVIKYVAEYEQNEVIGHNFGEFIYPDDHDKLFETFKKIIAGESQSSEYRIITKSGEIRWLWSSGKPNTEGDKIIGITGILSDITERKKAEEEIQQAHEELKQLYKYQEEIKENERAAISREIHDELGQSLSALKMDLGWTRNKVVKDTKLKMKIDGMLDIVNDTIKNVQRISADLRPGLLDDLGLVPAMEWYLQEFEKRTGIKINFKTDNVEYPSEKLNIALYRILQEVMTNIIRHAFAKNVEVNLNRNEDSIIFEVIDDGIGIKKEKIDSIKSLGLIGIRERLKPFGGSMKITSARKKGTKLRIIIPFY